MQKLTILFISAAIIQYLGLIAERWFFFAQANHPRIFIIRGHHRIARIGEKKVYPIQLERVDSSRLAYP